MSFELVEKEFTLGANINKAPVFQFYKQGFCLNSPQPFPTWRDVTISGKMSLTLLNAKANSLSYLKAFGRCEQGGLPFGYTQLEYIESSGTQYIDTNYKPNTNTKLTLKYYPHQNDAFMCLYGCQTSTSAQRFYGLVSSTQYKLQLNFTNASSPNFIGLNNDGTVLVTSNGTFTDDQKDVELSVSKDVVTIKTATQNLSYDMTPVANWGANVNCEYNMLLGSRSSAGVAGNNFVGKIYFATIQENNTIIHSFTPAKRNSDNAIGMYDTVTDTFLTNAGTDTFTAGPEIVPTPSNPLPIWCNNGELKVRSQGELPLGYQQIEYLQSDGACYIDTGRVPNNNDIIEQKFQKMGRSTETCAWYGSMPSSSTTTPRIGFGSYSQGMFCGVNTTTTLQASIDTNVHVAKFQATASNRMVVTYDGEIKEVSASGSGSGTLYSPAVTLTSYLFARHGIGGVQTYDGEGTRIYYHKEFLSNGTIQLDLVPCRRVSDGTLGMYDLVAEIFHPQYGSGTFTAGANIYDKEVYVDGTQETIAIDTTGDTATCENLLSAGDYKDVQSIIDGSVTRNVGIKILSGSENWSSGADVNKFTLSDAFTNLAQLTNAYVGYSNCYSVIPRSTSIQLYLANNQCGWNTTQVFCLRDDRFTTVEQFQSWLETQYANGTPVIIIYPTSSSTTETVTPQPMTIQAGTNIIEVTQSSINGLELEAQYKAGVSVTVTEIEDVNLDNSVTVTIS